MGEQIIINGLTLSQYMRKHVQELAALRSLLREMGEILKKTLPLTISASDYALRYGIEVLNDEALAVNAMFFEKDNDGILTRYLKAALDQGQEIPEPRKGE